MRLALFSMDCSYESSIVLKMHFPLFWYLHFEKKIQQLLIFASWWNVVLTSVLNIAGPPQNYSALRPVHCHRMRSLLHLRRSLRLLRLQMLQGHHVPLWLHIWLHCCLPHLCRGGGLARLGYKSTKSDFEQNIFNRVEQRPDSNVGGPSLWLDHYARPVRWPLHAWLPYRSSSSWQCYGLASMIFFLYVSLKKVRW